MKFPKTLSNLWHARWLLRRLTDEERAQLFSEFVRDINGQPISIRPSQAKETIGEHA